MIPRRLPAGNALYNKMRFEEALPFREAHAKLVEAYFSQVPGATEEAEGNLALTLSALGRSEEKLALERGMHARSVAERGPTHEATATSALRLGSTLMTLYDYAEARELLSANYRVAKRDLGPLDAMKLGGALAVCITNQLRDSAARTQTYADDATEAEGLLHDCIVTSRELLGVDHSVTKGYELMSQDLAAVRARVRDV